MCPHPSPLCHFTSCRAISWHWWGSLGRALPCDPADPSFASHPPPPTKCASSLSHTAHTHACMRTPSQSAGAPDSLFRSHPPTHTPLYPTLCIAPHHAHPCLSLFLSLHHMRTHTHTHLSLSSPADVEAACCCLPLLQMTLKLVWQSCTWWPNDSGWSGSAGNGVNRSRGITMTWRLLQGGRVPGLAGWLAGFFKVVGRTTATLLLDSYEVCYGFR